MRALAEACADEEIARWIDSIPHPYTERDARAFLAVSRRGWREGTLAAFAVSRTAGDDILGGIGIHVIEAEQAVAEIGYWVKREARRQGAATRAVRIASRWALEECEAERLQLRADVRNVASQRVAERAGFTREGVLRSSRYSDRQHRRVDFVIFSLLPDELQ